MPIYLLLLNPKTHEKTWELFYTAEKAEKFIKELDNDNIEINVLYDFGYNNNILPKEVLDLMLVEKDRQFKIGVKNNELRDTK